MKTDNRAKLYFYIDSERSPHTKKMSPYQKRYHRKSGAADFNWHPKNSTGSKSKALETLWKRCSEHFGLYKVTTHKKMSPYQKRYRRKSGAADFNWHTKNRIGSKSRTLEILWKRCSKHFRLYKITTHKKIIGAWSYKFPGDPAKQEIRDL